MQHAWLRKQASNRGEGEGIEHFYWDDVWWGRIDITMLVPVTSAATEVKEITKILNLCLNMKKIKSAFCVKCCLVDEDYHLS